MKILQIMSESVIVCKSSDSLSHAARLMWEHDCGALPIVDHDRRPIAMLTDRDICMAAYTQGRVLSELSVQGAMSRELVVCHPDDSVEQAEERMCAHQLRRLPVVDAAGQLVGILSLSDLVRVAALPQPSAHSGTNGVRLSAAARTLATVCTQRDHTSRSSIA